MVNRTTIGYFVMAVLAGGAIWGVLRFGSRMQAPRDIAGQYVVVEPGKADRRAVVQQSGVFLVLTVDGQKPEKIRFDETSMAVGPELRLNSYHLTRDVKDASR